MFLQKSNASVSQSSAVTEGYCPSPPQLDSSLDDIAPSLDDNVLQVRLHVYDIEYQHRLL